jgi:hypothetical protein
LLTYQTIAVDTLNALRKRVRFAQREKLALRDEILRIRAERDEVAARKDAIRIKHEAESNEALVRVSRLLQPLLCRFAHQGLLASYKSLLCHA